jgi:hypothetical protein
MTLWKFKKRVVRCKIQPQLCYGALFSKPRMANFRRLRAAAVNSFWGRGQSKRAPEIALVICSDPVRADPEMVIAAEAILSFARYLHRHLQEVVRYWNLAQTYFDAGPSKGAKADMPIRRLLNAIKAIGATISPYGIISLWPIWPQDVPRSVVGSKR